MNIYHTTTRYFTYFCFLYLISQSLFCSSNISDVDILEALKILDDATHQKLSECHVDDAQNILKTYIANLNMNIIKHLSYEDQISLIVYIEKILTAINIMQHKDIQNRAKTLIRSQKNNKITSSEIRKCQLAQNNKENLIIFGLFLSTYIVLQSIKIGWNIKYPRRDNT